MQRGSGIRGDYFCDVLGGWTQAVIAFASFGIILSRFRHGVEAADVGLAALFALEIVGAIAITRSKLPLMRFAFWLFTFRVIAGFAYMSAVHTDKLARSTLGFPFVVALYCFARTRSLKANP